MKISAQEQLLFNKNLNLNNAKGMTNAIAAEPPVDTPETKMSALDAMAQNNITFQAGLKVMQAVKNYSKKVAMAVMIGASTLVATTALPACESFVSVSNNVTVNVDTSALAALIQQMMDINQQLLEQQKINSQELAEMNGWLKQLYQAVIDGKMSAEEFYREFYEYMTLDSINQQIIIDQLVANGKTQEEANALLEQLIADVESGKITYEEAVAQIMAILNSIDGTLKDILTVVQGIGEDMNANHQEYMESKQKELDCLSNIYQQGQIDGETLKQLVTASDSANARVSRLVINSDSLLAIFSDETKCNEFMAQIKELRDEEVQKFEGMFKLFGMNLQDALEAYNKDNKQGQKEIVKAINDYKKTYLFTESVQTGVMAKIYKKLQFIYDYLPNLDQTEVIDAINDLKNSVDNNTGATQDTNAKLDVVNDKLDAIIAKMDNLNQKTDDLLIRFDDQQANWETEIGYLSKVDSTLGKIVDNQIVTNQYLSDFKNDFADMKAAQQLTNRNLNSLNQTADEIKDAIKDIDATGGAGMTVEQYIDASYKIDSTRAAKFEQFLTNYGFDKIPGDVQTIKDLSTQINNKIGEQKDCSDQLNRVIALEGDIITILKNYDKYNEEQRYILLQIYGVVESIKNNCCTDESITDLENMFK